MRTKAISLILLLAVICAYDAHAIAIGASPSRLQFQFSQGSFQEQDFQVSTNSEIPLDFVISVSSSLKGIVEVNPSARASRNEPALVKARASGRAKPGNYSGIITVSTVAGGPSDSGGSKVLQGVAVKVTVEVKPGSSSLLPILALMACAIILTAGTWWRSRR